MAEEGYDISEVAFRSHAPDNSSSVLSYLVSFPNSPVCRQSNILSLSLCSHLSLSLSLTHTAAYNTPYSVSWPFT